MAKQETLPEIGDISIPEIDLAMEDYQNWKECRMKFLAKEIETKEVVHSLMKKNNLTVYQYDSLIARIVEGEETVAVKRVKEKALAAAVTVGEETE